MSSQNGQQRSVPPGVRARIEAIKKIRKQEEMIKESMRKVKYKIAVLSGKGGVGKSFVTASLAFALAYMGKRVGVLDADIYGPSIPKMMGVPPGTVYGTEDGRLIPPTAPLGVKVLSVGLMLPQEDLPVIWRGPLSSSAIREMLAYAEWGELDYLLIDLPPGTGDEQLTIMQLIKDLTGVLIVTIPSDVSGVIVSKAVNFVRRLGANIIGIIENMSYFRCPDGSIHYIFGEGAGKKVAEKYNVRFLGEIPIDPRISRANDAGEPFFLKYPDSEASKAFLKIAGNVAEIVEGKSQNSMS
ncbi:Mrp/NBP35 family ATP-binding protein [Hyperthermus butylicus]|uniref:Iron-sulfur cluster carrier protein n=1 Tax=Hyperthermus butylicus (strain DSM 5456 / JCM 9403 / PLM1-5) TaxID=415426 RepID=A2BMA3_HYPBU|nr:Mrp/NBP35 family ATP-binding protein [Hyperthermus butylicus]ABM81114.1 nucleotide binding protein 2 [Hyperthermus butylicus DSM 5456]